MSKVKRHISLFESDPIFFTWKFQFSSVDRMITIASVRFMYGSLPSGTWVWCRGLEVNLFSLAIYFVQSSSSRERPFVEEERVRSLTIKAREHMQLLRDPRRMFNLDSHKSTLGEYAKKQMFSEFHDSIIGMKAIKVTVIVIFVIILYISFHLFIHITADTRYNEHVITRIDEWCRILSPEQSCPRIVWTRGFCRIMAGGVGSSQHFGFFFSFLLIISWYLNRCESSNNTFGLIDFLRYLIW